MADSWKELPYSGHLVAVNTADQPVHEWRRLEGWKQISEPVPGKVFDVKFLDSLLGWRAIALTDQGVFELDGSAWKKVEAENGR